MSKNDDGELNALALSVGVPKIVDLNECPDEILNLEQVCFNSWCEWKLAIRFIWQN